MPRLVYVDRDDLETVAGQLARRLFADYEGSSIAFTLLGEQGSGLLDSALALPRQKYYRTVFDKAAVLLRSLIKNHPFLDGNKRVAVTSVMLFLLFNGRFIVSTQEELVEFALEIARSEPDIGWREISEWIRSRTMTLHGDEQENVRRLLAIHADMDLPVLRDRLVLIMDALRELSTAR